MQGLCRGGLNLKVLMASTVLHTMLSAPALHRTTFAPDLAKFSGSPSWGFVLSWRAEGARLSISTPFFEGIGARCFKSNRMKMEGHGLKRTECRRIGTAKDSPFRRRINMNWTHCVCSWPSSMFSHCITADAGTTWLNMKASRNHR